ncbi:MAG: hypothetical protein AAFV25_24975 [Bacteroidota bacterium]
MSTATMALRWPFKPSFKHGIFMELPNKQFGHSGEDPGIITFAYYNKTKDRGMLFFLNTSSGKNLEEEINKVIRLLVKYMNQPSSAS